MPKISPRGSLAVSNFKKDRGGLFIPQNVTPLSTNCKLLYKILPKYELEPLLSANTPLWGGIKKGPRLGVPGPFSPHFRHCPIPAHKALKSNARPFFCQSSKSDLFTAHLGGDISGVGGSRNGQKGRDPGLMALGIPDRNQRRKDQKRRFAASFDCAEKASFKAFGGIKQATGSVGRFPCGAAKVETESPRWRVAGVSL